MMERIEFPLSLEIETKIDHYCKETGKTRDEVIAEVLSSFLSSQGL